MSNKHYSRHHTNRNSEGTTETESFVRSYYHTDGDTIEPVYEHRYYTNSTEREDHSEPPFHQELVFTPEQGWRAVNLRPGARQSTHPARSVQPSLSQYPTQPALPVPVYHDSSSHKKGNKITYPEAPRKIVPEGYYGTDNGYVDDENWWIEPVRAPSPASPIHPRHPDHPAHPEAGRKGHHQQKRHQQQPVYRGLPYEDHHVEWYPRKIPDPAAPKYRAREVLVLPTEYVTVPRPSPGSRKGPKTTVTEEYRRY